MDFYRNYYYMYKTASEEIRKQSRNQWMENYRNNPSDDHNYRMLATIFLADSGKTYGKIAR